MYLAAAGAQAAGQTAPGPQSLANPDTLYAQRENLNKAREAVDVWHQRLRRDGRDFEAAWKLARARYWIGTHETGDARAETLTLGIRSAEHAVRLEPDRPEGHFWMAANMGALAESGGLMAGLRYRGRIKDELERVLAIDPAWQQGSADRALGRWYFKVPGLFGGSNAEAERHLRASLTYNPESTASLVFLAEVLIAEDRTDEAIAILKRAIAAPVDPAWAPEDREFKTRAQQLLRDVSRTKHQAPARRLSTCRSPRPSSGRACPPAPSA